jgi:hypothetical protein
MWIIDKYNQLDGSFIWRPFLETFLDDVPGLLASVVVSTLHNLRLSFIKFEDVHRVIGRFDFGGTE